MSELITADDYASLPDDPYLKFVGIEEICRRNMRRMIDHDERSDYGAVREEYMMIVSTAATALGVDELPYPHGLEEPWRGIDIFLLTATEITTRLRLSQSISSSVFSVRLAARTRGRIEQQIQTLRIIISTEDMPEARRKAVLKKLDELSIELSQTRVNFAKVMSVLAHVSVVVASGTTFLADAPHAITTISSLLGHDKMAEDAEAHRLGAPPKQKAIPAPSRPFSAPPLNLRTAADGDVLF